MSGDKKTEKEKGSERSRLSEIRLFATMSTGC